MELLECTVIITIHFKRNEFTNLITFIIFKIGNIKQYKKIYISVINAESVIIKTIVINKLEETRY